MTRTVALTILLLSASSLLIAQESNLGPTYLFLVEAEIEKARLSSWSEAVAALGSAHDQHPAGGDWATYRRLTGGPDVVVNVFRGFEELAELDGWTSNRRILVDAFGPLEGGRVHSELSVGVTSSDRVLAVVAELSRPWPGVDSPRYLWVETVRVADGRMTEYAALAKRVRRAYDEHGQGIHWLCYANAIGGTSSELRCYFGFNAFSEVDSWPSRRQVLAAAIGDREGRRLASALEAVSETTTSLWRLEPGLSRSSAGE
jgi:hypothetical protein